MGRPRVGVALAVVCTLACGSTNDKTPGGPAPRTYRMGFSAIPPRFDVSLVAGVVDLWSRRADAAIMPLEPQWGELLAGADPAALIARDHVGIAQYFRAKG